MFSAHTESKKSKSAATSFQSFDANIVEVESEAQSLSKVQTMSF